MKQQVIFHDLCTIGYKEAWDYQERLMQENLAVKAEMRGRQSAVRSLQSTVHSPQSTVTDHSDDYEPETKDYLLFCEHPPVYTLGKSGSVSNILISEKERIEKGIAFFPTNRGGDITFHGPEQLVGYPILDLERYYTDIGKYLRNLEEVIILTMADYGLTGERSPGETGVWMQPGVKGNERKICAMGVRCSRWVTMHGFAFNVNTGLEYFDYIIPCGIAGKKVTSLQKELGCTIPMDEVKEKVKKNFEKVFDCELVSAVL
jgi:lipoyl(octanoyl) transferase